MGKSLGTIPTSGGEEGDLCVYNRAKGVSPIREQNDGRSGNLGGGGRREIH